MARGRSGIVIDAIPNASETHWNGFFTATLPPAPSAFVDHPAGARGLLVSGLGWGGFTSFLLNEFCVASGYHREYAIRLLCDGPPPPRSEHRRLDRDAGASANLSSGYEIMQQLAYATLVEDGERVVDEVGYAEVRVRGLHG
jgi:hypothetical protein